MIRLRNYAGIVVLLALAGRAWGTEPNETVATATVLGSGVLSVADELTSPNLPNPDTVLGARDLLGSVYLTDDDGSHLGDDFASALYGVVTNSGSIDFVISGYPDDIAFDGSHVEEGYYEVFVDVRDFFGDLVDEFSEVRLLEPGIVHEFSYSDAAWISGDYDVYIDNTVGAVLPSDVDFFTFTGLTAGGAFTVQTTDPDENGIDTYLGWFDSGGSLLAADDDTGGGPFDLLSLLEGVVPANGMLTFAVTGFGDGGFVGFHDKIGTYGLVLEADVAGLDGDYNHDGSVDTADYVVWRKELGTPEAYDLWRANFGEPGGGSGSGGAILSQSAVPEPTCLFMCGVGCVAFLTFARRSPA